MEISALHDVNVEALFIKMVELIRDSVLPFVDSMKKEKEKGKPRISNAGSTSSDVNN